MAADLRHGICVNLRHLRLGQKAANQPGRCTVAAAEKFTGRESRLVSLRGYESSSGSMEQVVLVNYALAAQRAGGWGPWAGAHGIQDAAPPGLSSQPDCNSTIRAHLHTVLLRVSESPWFNLPFAFMHTDEAGYEAKLGRGLQCIPANLQTVWPSCRAGDIQ